MNKSMIVSITLCVLMALSGVLAKVMTPAEISPALRARINLETLIPKEFEGWKLDSSSATGIVNPAVKGELENIYNQTLSRTYINDAGDRVMLSIAYGGAQKTDMHAHRPEICYAAGGFDISKKNKTFVDTTIGRIPVMHLVAKQGMRNEPITYWIRVGDSLTRGWIEQKLTAIGYGLTGKVPDGLLVRVSSISNDEQDSYRVQQVFLSAMLKAVRSEDRSWLVGRLNS
jgi:EpsI family protein